MTVSLDRPWLTFDLGEPMRVLSWALNRPGFVTARRIVWREVRNADLPEGFDVRKWLETELQKRDAVDSIAFLTSRNIDRFQQATATIGAVRADAVATVGLSNAERIGYRQPKSAVSYGTINVAVRLNTGLSEAGLIEAMSIVVQARTAAVMDADIALPSGPATGTGTDCVAIAAPPGSTDYAGLHTDIGKAIGRAVYDAVFSGAKEWKEEVTANA
ncbi:MAG: adenosylcobinamide amidohydrolase [Pseudomonadota bacterium]